MPRINPDILRWAHETAGLDLETAASKVALGSARGLSGAERLAALEAGDVDPSRPQLLKMARQYHRPLLVFYLSAPPRKGDRGQDFRTLPEGSSVEEEAVLDVLLRDILSRQALVRAALEDEEERLPLEWVGSAKIGEGSERLVQRIRDSLGVILSDLRASQTPEDAFKLLRDLVEASGVYVVLASNLGSHHTTLGTDVFRGLAIADPIAPFIVVNDQDSRTAWSFTLIHELAHLWLGYTGVSGGTFDREVERFCNEVASEFLLPATELRDFAIGGAISTSRLEEAISSFANERKVSRSMVAYRLYLRESITAGQWKAVTGSFRRQWLDQQGRQRVTGRESKGGTVLLRPSAASRRRGTSPYNRKAFGIRRPHNREGWKGVRRQTQ